LPTTAHLNSNNSDKAEQKMQNDITTLKCLSTAVFTPEKHRKISKPKWHAPWKLYRVICGHLGWVRSVAFEPTNDWFCTGSADRTIKIWDTFTGELKLTLTGHIEQVTGLEVSKRHPYMFSCV